MKAKDETERLKLAILRTQAEVLRLMVRVRELEGKVNAEHKTAA